METPYTITSVPVSQAQRVEYASEAVCPDGSVPFPEIDFAAILLVAYTIFTIVAIVANFSRIAAWCAERVDRLRAFAFRQGIVGCVLLGLFVFGMVCHGNDSDKPPVTPPVIVVSGITIKTIESDADGFRMTWDCDRKKINVGTDTFIIQESDRQIPSRTGWSAWRTIHQTKDLSCDLPVYMRGHDTRVKLIVIKEQ